MKKLNLKAVARAPWRAVMRVVDILRLLWAFRSRN